MFFTSQLDQVNYDVALRDWLEIQHSDVNVKKNPYEIRSCK